MISNRNREEGLLTNLTSKWGWGGGGIRVGSSTERERGGVNRSFMASLKIGKYSQTRSYVYLINGLMNSFMEY